MNRQSCSNFDIFCWFCFSIPDLLFSDDCLPSLSSKYFCLQTCPIESSIFFAFSSIFFLCASATSGWVSWLMMLGMLSVTVALLAGALRRLFFDYARSCHINVGGWGPELNREIVSHPCARCVRLVRSGWKSLFRGFPWEVFPFPFPPIQLQLALWVTISHFQPRLHVFSFSWLCKSEKSLH